jgi:peptidoglycan/LPS O-acetylase OafA/YrhL
MTRASCRQGAINALVVFAVFMAIWASVATVISAFANMAFGTALAVSFIGIGFLVFFLFVRSLRRGQRTAGRVLLDCGSFPAASSLKLTIISAPVVVLYATYLFDGWGLRLAAMAFGMAMIIFSYVMSRSRLQICEHGIWLYSDLLKWERIESWQWVDDKSLRFTRRGNFPLVRRGVIQVPPEQRTVVSELLLTHVSRPPQTA